MATAATRTDPTSTAAARDEVRALTNARRFTIVAGLALALVFVSCASATAETIAQAKAQAAAAQAQVTVLQNKAEMATENWDAARARFNKLSAQEQVLRSKIAVLATHQKNLQTKLDSRVGVMYRQGPLGVLSMLLDVRTIDGLVTAMHAMTEISRHDSATIVQLKAAKAEAVTAHTSLVAARRAADKQQRVMAANAATRKAQAAAEAKVLAGLNANVKRLIAEQKAREAAIARARARAALARARAAMLAQGRSGRRAYGSFLGGSNGFGGNPPASGRGAKAVWWAERQLGRPYRWGAAGPYAFDCSGLVMWAYRHVGVSLPHHAASQIGHGSRVSRGNLQPGDLVFFGYPIHHVGMYVGGGDFIEAPYTGANVRISSLRGRGDFAGACRP